MLLQPVLATFRHNGRTGRELTTVQRPVQAPMLVLLMLKTCTVGEWTVVVTVVVVDVVAVRVVVGVVVVVDVVVEDVVFVVEAIVVVIVAVVAAVVVVVMGVVLGVVPPNNVTPALVAVVVTVLATVDTTLVFEVPNDGRKVVGQSQSRAIATVVLRAMAEIDKIATTTKNS